MSRTNRVRNGKVDAPKATLDSAKPAVTTLTGHAAIPVAGRTPERFTYGLKAYTTQRRADGWWMARTPFAAAGETIEWHGPFTTIEDACLAIARYLATELANRHTVQVGFYRIKTDHPLYGLKPTTRLATPRKGLRTR